MVVDQYLLPSIAVIISPGSFRAAIQAGRSKDRVGTLFVRGLPRGSGSDVVRIDVFVLEPDLHMPGKQPRSIVHTEQCQQVAGRAYFKLGQLLQSSLIEFGLAEQSLELAVLLLEFTNALGVRHLHAAVLDLPAVNAVLGNTVTPG